MDSFMNTSKNYSLFAVPAALVMAFVPKVYGSILGQGIYDNANPRKYMEAIDKCDSIDKMMKNRLHRCEAAHSNGMETLPLFAGGVVAANMAGVPVQTINMLAFSYIISRGFYNVIYVVLQDNRNFAPVRSLAWSVGAGLWVTMFIKAGYKMLEASS